VDETEILAAFKNAPKGNSQIGLSEATGINCGFVMNWLKEYAAEVRTKGERQGEGVVSESSH